MDKQKKEQQSDIDYLKIINEDLRKIIVEHDKKLKDEHDEQYELD